MLHKVKKISAFLIVSFVLSGCSGGSVATKTYDSKGDIVSEDLNARKAVEVYGVEPKDMSYVNLEPDVDYDVVQKDGVVVYDLEHRRTNMTHNQRVETQSRERWSTLISMWRGGLNIGASLYDDDKKNYNE